MGIFSRLFGKREELDEELGLEKAPLEEPFLKEQLGLEEKPLFPEEGKELGPHLAETSFSRQASTQISARDVELLSSKLDTIKAILNSLEQRMANLEKAAGVEQQKRMPW